MAILQLESGIDSSACKLGISTGEGLCVEWTNSVEDRCLHHEICRDRPTLRDALVLTEGKAMLIELHRSGPRRVLEEDLHSPSNQVSTTAIDHIHGGLQPIGAREAIRIGEGNYATPSLPYPRISGRVRTCLRLRDHPSNRVVLSKLCDIAGRSIIHHDDFKAALIGLLPKCIHAHRNSLSIVVGRNHNGDVHYAFHATQLPNLYKRLFLIGAIEYGLQLPATYFRSATSAHLLPS